MNKTLVVYALMFILAILSTIAFMEIDKKNSQERNKLDNSVLLSGSGEDAFVSFKESKDRISLIINKEEVQTIAISDEILSDFIIDLENPYTRNFITDLDVNFDGYKDAGVITGVGYGGVNNFYDFYIYNIDIQKLEKSEKLQQISNPDVDIKNKTITSSYRSGPIWYVDKYIYKNGDFEYVQDEEAGKLVGENNETSVCTADAKICPDGSAVGRSGPSCEFMACPSSDSTPAMTTTFLGGSITAMNVTVSPQEIISDSRCPSGVQCVWAGTVEVRTRLSTQVAQGEHILELGKPQVFGEYNVTLTEVMPSKTQEAISMSDYRFTFEITR